MLPCISPASKIHLRRNWHESQIIDLIDEIMQIGRLIRLELAGFGFFFVSVGRYFLFCFFALSSSIFDMFMRAQEISEENQADPKSKYALIWIENRLR